MKRNCLLIPVLAIASLLSLYAQEFTDTLLPYLLEAERENLPVEGELLYDCFDLSGYTFSNNNGATQSLLDETEHGDFGKKFHLDIKKAGTNAWEPQFQSPLNAIPVDVGDVLLYVFYIRTTDTESPNDFGQAAFFAQKASSPWTGIGSLSLSLSTSWRKLYVVTESNTRFEVGEMGSTIHLGFLQQTVEIGGILALNLGDVNTDDLPSNDILYEGMEPDAEWRTAAEARIEEHRKSDIRVVFTDDEGVPVQDAFVSIQMKDHAYGFGNFSSGILLDNTSDGDNYRSHILDMFNVATTPFYMGGNGDNWGWYGSGSSQDDYPAMAAWMKENGLPTKGHVLVWPGWSWMPSFFEDLKNDTAALRAAIEEHLETIVPIGKENELYEWDVVNEPYINHDVMDLLGDEVMADWYKQVHELDPESRLILNEYNIIMGGGRSDFQENFERVITLLQSEGAPLDGIGMQCHFDENLTGIPRVLEILDRFEKFGLPIQITEFDVAIRDEDIQARYLEDFYTAAFSHPATDKIVMWGFYEKVMWKPLGALVRSDWTTKPNYDVYMDLLYNQWWTPDFSGSPDAEGALELRGFNGIYEIQVAYKDSSYTYRDRLIESDTTLVLSPAGANYPLGISGKDKDATGIFVSYPNPFSDELILSYTLEAPAELSIQFYGVDGAMVDSKIVSAPLAGTQTSSFDFSDLPAGIYMCVVDSDAPELAGKTLKIVKE